jgi:AcrR family transcriptional regulator
LTNGASLGTFPAASMAYKKSEISAAHIVEAATRVLARQGYARTSLMDIAQEAGMSKGAVHYHFPTKESLMGVVLTTACQAVANRTLNAWTQGSDALGSLRSSLLELWRVRAERGNEAAVVADLLAQSLHDEKLRQPLAEYYRFASTQVLEHLTVHLMQAGLKPRVPPEMLPRILHGLLDGLLMQHIVDPEAIKEEHVIQALETIAASMFET